ncbi:MAG: hypothetical protein B7Y90_05720 [Alphaproteobacteria bacterium 32-64-14]|nr:MAG: hypothetical protein B7Y90_05720 [Alphaproteobacteria bacterium 32-64-14]
MTLNPIIIKRVAIEALRPRPDNPRKHTPRQVEQIRASIASSGYNSPIVVDGRSEIIAGEGRWLALKALGHSHIDVVCRDDMTEAQIRAYRIADNKIAENAGWDDNLLRLELGALLELDVEIQSLGFETGEIDALFKAELNEEEVAQEPGDQPAVSQVGDLWLMGQHALYCGDALDERSHKAVLRGSTAAAVFADVPYNIPTQGFAVGKGKIKHRQFVEASGEMSDAAFRTFLTSASTQMAASLRPGGIAFVCIDWRHVDDVIAAGLTAFSEIKNICVWDKGVGGMGSFYRSQHELVVVFKSGDAAHTNNVQLGKHGRNRSNVWYYSGVLTRRGDLKLHPTVKPVLMVADAICDVTRRGEIVLDPFLGSGTTLIAAHRTGRRGAGIELDPLYADVAIRRFTAETGVEAVHAETGETFNQVADRILTEAPAHG